MSCCNADQWGPGLEPGWQQLVAQIVPFSNSNYQEFINYQVPQGVTTFSIPLSVVKSSSNMVLLGTGTLSNVVDSTPSIVMYTVTSYTTSAISVLMTGTVSTAHYYIKGILLVMGA